MPTKPKTFRPAGAPTKQQRRKQHDQARGTAAQRGPYNTKWWEHTRIRIARRDNWQCVDCGKDVGLTKGDFHCEHDQERPLGAPIDTSAHDSDANLRTRCVSCSNAKTGRYVQRNGTPLGSQGQA